MSILDRMRSGSDSTGMQVIFAMIIIAFVGVYAQAPGDKASIVATVNGTRIMDMQYGRLYRQQVRVEEQRTQRTLSDAEQKSLGERVRQQLIEGEVLVQEAVRLGMHVSDAEVALQLMQIPGIRDSDDKYRQFLKRNQYTKSDFEESLRDELLRAKLQQLVYTGASLSEPAIREAYIEAQTAVDLNIVRVRPSVFEDDLVVSEADRATWLAENEVAVKDTYERDLDRLYDHPEKVHVRMIRLAVHGEDKLVELMPRLADLRAQVAAGADMAELAKRWSEDPSARNGGDLGVRPVSQLSSQEIKALDGLKSGELSRAVPGDNDARLLYLVERIAPRVDAFDDVKAAIAEGMIRAERVPALAAEFAEKKLLAAWVATGEVPDEILLEQGLTARPTGLIPTRNADNPFLPPQKLLDAARGAKVGTVFPEVFEQGGVFWVAQLIDRTDADLSGFNAEQGGMREQVLLARRAEFHQAWVTDLKSRASIE